MSIKLSLPAGISQKITVTTSSAQTAAIAANSATIYSTVNVFVRQGTNPTAVADGTDQFIPADTFISLEGLTAGNKIAIIGEGSGTAYITPGA